MPVDHDNPGYQAEQKLIKAYKSFANTPEGKTILKDLTDRFLWQDSREHVGAGNALGVVYIDAHRMLMKYILRKIEVPEDELLQAFQLPQDLLQGDPLETYGQSHREPRSRGYL
jgi:hypothetical protein